MLRMPSDQNIVQRQITNHHVKEDKFANVITMIIKEIDLNIALVFKFKGKSEILETQMIMETSLPDGKGLKRSHLET